MAIRTITVPVKDLDAATALYTKLLGTDPYMATPYYVGFRPEGSPEVGLNPHGDLAGGPITYYHVDDINAGMRAVLDAGGAVQQEARDVGGGRQVGAVTDPEGNVIGFIQDA